MKELMTEWRKFLLTETKDEQALAISRKVINDIKDGKFNKGKHFIPVSEFPDNLKFPSHFEGVYFRFQDSPKTTISVSGGLQREEDKTKEDGEYHVLSKTSLLLIFSGNSFLKKFMSDYIGGPNTNDLISQMKPIIRHELEHAHQKYRKDMEYLPSELISILVNKDMDNSKLVSVLTQLDAEQLIKKYYLNENELPAHLAQFMKQAKLKSISYVEELKAFFDQVEMLVTLLSTFQGKQYDPEQTTRLLKNKYIDASIKRFPKQANDLEQLKQGI